MQIRENKELDPTTMVSKFISKIFATRPTGPPSPYKPSSDRPEAQPSDIGKHTVHVAKGPGIDKGGQECRDHTRQATRVSNLATRRRRWGLMVE